MKIGIFGEITSRAGWEQRLARHHEVSEVHHLLSLDSILTSTCEAVIYIDASEHSFHSVSQIVRSGKHVFLIGKLPLRKVQIDQLFHNAEESGCFVQLPHWSSYSPATGFIKNAIQQPSIIHIEKHLHFHPGWKSTDEFVQLWLDDLAYCISLAQSTIHRVDVNVNSTHPADLRTFQLFLRFDNACTASIILHHGTFRSSYSRVVCNHKTSFYHDVFSQKLKMGTRKNDDTWSFSEQHFEGEEPADRALKLFLETIREEQPPEFSVYEASKMVRVVQTINDRLFRR